MYYNPNYPTCYPVAPKQEMAYPQMHTGCPQLPGTVLRISIPAGAVVNLLNLIEVSSPSGVCLIARLPMLGGSKGASISSLLDTVRQAGGNVEVVG